MESDSFLLRARVVVPVSRPPIDEGAVFVSGERICEVGEWSDLAARHPDRRVIDLADQILLPGLINTHCHLDYTRMAGGIPPRKSFSDWIKAILAYKADWSYTDFAESWMAGANMLLKYGTTTVLDIEAVPELLSEVWSSTPLRVISALEMTGIRSGRKPDEILAAALAAVPGAAPQNKTVALSPHSLYSTQPDLIRIAADTARKRGWLMTTHVSESTEELDMFLRQSGPLHDWLQPQRDMSDCAGESPVTRLNRLGALSENFIAVHANCLDEADLELLADHGCSVVHCPRSHDYFQHPAFPLEQLRQRGINLCLGTDSLASVRGTNRPNIELNLFKEMQSLAKTNPGVSAEFILRMATVNGARAINQTGEIGEITVGATADLVAIPRRFDVTDPYRTIIEHQGPVTFSMIDGRQVQPAEGGQVGSGSAQE